jgi:hypothetical protein
VEREAVAGVDAAFTAWLVTALEGGGLVAAPEGECAGLEFGAVRTVGREVEMTWMRFVRNPGRVVRQLAREGSRLDRPVVVGRRYGREVWLAVGSHCAAGTADAVVIG